MGGFLVNGCGASDSYYTLRTLPNHLCRSCGKADYAVMELKRKIRVFYIPTVSIDTKYAVVCPKCKQGYYISDEQKDYILSHDASCVEMLSDRLRIHRDKAADSTPPVPPVPAHTCTCGAALAPGARFCTKCGARAADVAVDPPPEPPAPEPEPPIPDIGKDIISGLSSHNRGTVCPGCGMRLMNPKDVCSICGTKLT